MLSITSLHHCYSLFKKMGVVAFALFIVGVTPLLAQDNALPSADPNANPNAPRQAPKVGALLYEAKSLDKNLVLGDYSLNWAFDDQSFDIKTSLFPKGMLTLFIDYHLREFSKGRIEQGQLIWQTYEYNQVHEKGPYTFETAKMNGAGKIIFSVGKEEEAKHTPFDIPSAYLSVMRDFAEPSLPQDWARTLHIVYSKDSLPVNLHRMNDETITLATGTHKTRRVGGQADKRGLFVWFDRATHIPIKVQFNNNRGEKFELNLTKILSLQY